MIEQGLVTYLLAQSGITDYVSDRIFPVKADQDVDTPYMVYAKTSDPREHSHDGNSHLGKATFEIAVFSDTYKECKDVAAALQTALQGYTGLMGSVDVRNVIYVDETDGYDDDLDLFGVVTTYKIWYID